MKRPTKKWSMNTIKKEEKCNMEELRGRGSGTATSNTAKTLRNSIFAVVAQIISFLLVFVNRKVFVLFLDIEYLGYQSLFSNVFTLLSVAELGIGTAISYHLYKEIVNNNEEEIGRLMYVYKILYRIVAFVVLGIGAGCFFLTPYIIKETTLSTGHLATIYFLQLGSTFLGYFLSYKQVLLTAAQQEYKITTVTLFVSVGIQLLQLLFLFLFRSTFQDNIVNYLIYLGLNLSTGLIGNIILSIMVDKQYPYLRLKYKITKEYLKERNFFQNFRNVVVQKISYAIYGGTDNIVISSFLGVTYVAIYGNYVAVKTGVMNLLFYKLLNPVQATIGNIVYSDRSKEDLWQQFKTFDMFSFFFATFISLGFLTLYQPFIQLWMGKEYLLPMSFVILFCISIYFGAVWEILYKYRSVFGDFKKDMWYLVAAAVLNIGISILAVYFMGITGIQLATIIAYFSIAIGRIRFVIKYYFEKSALKYFLMHMLLFLIAAIEGAGCYFSTYWMPVNIPYFLLRIAIWLFLPTIVSVLIFFKNPYFKGMISYFKNALRVITNKFKKKKENNV